MARPSPMSAKRGAARRWPAAAVLATLGLAVPMSQAMAVEVNRYDYQGAAAVCQPTLPQHGANLRAQPLRGLSNLNEEDTIFVTCGYRGDDTTVPRGAWRVIANAANYGSSLGAIVSCTLVNGRAIGPDSNATYTTRSVFVALGGGATIFWTAADIEGGPPTISRPAIMCSVPAGASLQFVGIHYAEDVGG